MGTSLLEMEAAKSSCRSGTALDGGGFVCMHGCGVAVGYQPPPRLSAFRHLTDFYAPNNLEVPLQE